MSLTAKQGDSDFEMCPVGNFAGRCYMVVDLGMREKGGQFPGLAHQMRWSFEVDERMSNGEPYSISEILTISLGKKAKLRERLKTWRGRDFTEQELAGFDLKKVVGVPCLLNVVHNESGGKTYANIASITPLPKGMKAPEPFNKPLTWEFGDDERDLPDWLRKFLGTDPDGPAQTASDPTASYQSVPAGDDFDDDEIPF